MRGNHETSTNFVGLLTLVLFYLVLIILVVMFSRQIVAEADAVGSLTTVATVVLAIILPLVLVAGIALNIGRLIRDRARHTAGSRLKTRLLFFFALVAVLAMLPQAILSTTFIDSAINFWLSAGVEDSIEGGLTISLAYHTEKVRNLSSFAASPLLPALLAPLRDDPEQAWQNLRSANPEIGLLQVFDESGAERVFRGPESVRWVDGESLPAAAGSPVRTSRGDSTVLRVMAPDPTSEGRVVVLGIVYPRQFDELATRITSTRRLFRQLASYQGAFRTVVVGFYFVFSFPILLLAILVSFVLTEDIIRPIVHLERATRRVAEGDFSFRLLSRRGDELATLVESFNRMVGELDRSRSKLVQAEKHAAWKDIAQRLAHEIRNPLTPIKLSAQRILRRTNASRSDSVIERSVSAIVKEVDNLNHLLVEFREFTRLPELVAAPVAMTELLDEVVSVYRNLSNRVDFEQRYRADQDLVFADRSQLKQVFANLVKNAIQALPDGGKITIATDLVTKNEKSYLRVQISDTGPGIDAASRDSVFEPYYTTKKDGSGLGLAIVERIIFDHNGSIWFESRSGVGTTFFVDIPAGTR